MTLNVARKGIFYKLDEVYTRHFSCLFVSVVRGFVCTCVCLRERERERENMSMRTNVIDRELRSDCSVKIGNKEMSEYMIKGE